MCRFSLFSAILLGLLHATTAHAVTAVCKEPTGRIFGVDGTVLGKGKALDEPDGMKGGRFTIVWNRSQKQAQITSQGSGGGEPMTDTGIRVFESDEQVSFLVVYPSSVWLYSLYRKPKLLLMTTHNNGVAIDVGGAVVKSFKAACEISEN
jgi:hypothetical protein